jgi:dihydroorotate dehydrogenase (NAD+) catalytic subunit
MELIDLRVRIGPLELKNPMGVASGTYGYGSEYEELIDIDALGALFTKVVTPEPRKGNEVPRIVETPAGMLNSIGLANPGLEAFVRTKLPALRGRGCAVIVNVAGATEDEYARVIEGLDAQEGIAGYEVNVSCPNVKKGGMAFGTDAATLESLVRSLRPRTSRPLIVKLSPNVTDIRETAKAAEASGADALSCINTLVGMVIDVRTGKPVIPAGTAGLSGPAIRPVGVACVYRVARAVEVPVIGVGGIVGVDDALQYLMAGACAVQVGTGNFIDPSAPLRILKGIAEHMRREGIESMEGFKRYREDIER